jgi:uncharacterized protein (DUF111 family)
MSKRSEIPIEIDAGVTTEMVTPSGYAILNGLGAKFRPGIQLRTVREGCGFGKRDTGRLGAVRAVIGETV